LINGLEKNFIERFPWITTWHINNFFQNFNKYKVYGISRRITTNNITEELKVEKQIF
jgi:hypothetical protein